MMSGNDQGRAWEGVTPVLPVNPSILSSSSSRIRQDNRKPGSTGQEGNNGKDSFFSPFPYLLFSSPVYPENPVILSSSSPLQESDRITGSQDQQDKKVIMEKILSSLHSLFSSSLLLSILKILLSCPSSSSSSLHDSDDEEDGAIFPRSLYFRFTTMPLVPKLISNPITIPVALR